MTKDKTKAGDTLKTSFKLTRDLWKRAHVRAMDDGVDLQDLMVKALEAYLKGGPR
jgi:hypothetical protein